MFLLQIHYVTANVKPSYQNSSKLPKQQPKRAMQQERSRSRSPKSRSQVVPQAQHEFKKPSSPKNKNSPKSKNMDTSNGQKVGGRFRNMNIAPGEEAISVASSSDRNLNGNHATNGSTQKADAVARSRSRSPRNLKRAGEMLPKEGTTLSVDSKSTEFTKEFMPESDHSSLPAPSIGTVSQWQDKISVHDPDGQTIQVHFIYFRLNIKLNLQIVSKISF